MLGAKLETGNPRAQNCPDIHLIAFMLDSLRSFNVHDIQGLCSALINCSYEIFLGKFIHEF